MKFSTQVYFGDNLENVHSPAYVDYRVFAADELCKVRADQAVYCRCLSRMLQRNGRQLFLKILRI